jgi:hypothetical protein
VNRELSLLRRVELEVQSLQSMKNKEVRRRARQFVRQNTFTLLISVGVLGAAAGAAYLYFSKHPRTVEWLIVSKALAAFNNALTFDQRKRVYFSLPELSFPVPLDLNNPHELVALLGCVEGGGVMVPGGMLDFVNGWATLVNAAFKEADSSWPAIAKGGYVARLDRGGSCEERSGGGGGGGGGRRRRRRRRG